mgnify:CR=1 FL=1
MKHAHAHLKGGRDVRSWRDWRRADDLVFAAAAAKAALTASTLECREREARHAGDLRALLLMIEKGLKRLSEEPLMEIIL